MTTGYSGPVGFPILYEGDPITLQKGEGAWVPVIVPDIAKSGGSGALCVFPCSDSSVEAVSGAWDISQQQGVVCVIGK